jgi:hypothetical protein
MCLIVRWSAAKNHRFAMLLLQCNDCCCFGKIHPDRYATTGTTTTNTTGAKNAVFGMVNGLAVGCLTAGTRIVCGERKERKTKNQRNLRQKRKRTKKRDNPMVVVAVHCCLLAFVFLFWWLAGCWSRRSAFEFLFVWHGTFPAGSAEQTPIGMPSRKKIWTLGDRPTTTAPPIPHALFSKRNKIILERPIAAAYMCYRRI